jgi:hypothetical protein
MKKVAFNGPLLSFNGYYMGLNLSLFLKIGAYMGTDFRERESDGFTGRFWGIKLERNNSTD